MKKNIDPKTTSRAQAFELWMKSPMPMVTLVKTFDVTNLVKFSKRTGMKFNMLLGYCIGMAARKIEEFYFLPVEDSLWQYDSLAINVIVTNSKGGINSCDIPFSENLSQYNADYLRLTRACADTCESYFLDEYVVVGTSALVQTEIDCIVNQYTYQWNNPFVSWAKIRKHLFKSTLPISFQFHHVQMDGAQGARFLDNLQNEIKNLK